jgi:hypothetical protein
MNQTYAARREKNGVAKKLYRVKLNDGRGE